MNLNRLFSLARQVETFESHLSKYHYIGCYYNKNFKLFDTNILSYNFDEITSDESYKNLIEFICTEREVFFIPNILDGEIIEIICRSTRSKRFINISKGIPSVFYGIGMLDKNRHFSDPVILCEGTADCEYIKHNINNNAIACLTDSISILKLEVLKTLTNHVILSFDNDRSGEESEARESKKLRRLGFFVETMHPQPWYKDYGDMIKDESVRK